MSTQSMKTTGVKTSSPNTSVDSAAKNTMPSGGGNTTSQSLAFSSILPPPPQSPQTPASTMNEIRSMFSAMKQQLEMSNQRVAAEMTMIRKDQMLLTSKVNAMSPIQPRALSFGEATGLSNTDEFIPMEAAVDLTAGQDKASPPSRMTTSSVQHLYGMPAWTTTETLPMERPSGPSHQGVNHIDSTAVTIETNNLGPSGNFNFNNNIDNAYVPFANPLAGNLLEKRLQDVEKMLMNVPGVAQPIKQMSSTCYNQSRFAPHIAAVDIPKKFFVPQMKMYDGNSDPEEHVAHYMEKMGVVHIPAQYREACLCRGFGSTLVGSALKWLIRQKEGSINSFAQLINMFNNQFTCSRQMEKLTSDLYKIVQQPNEPLRDYVARFNKEVLDIQRLDVTTACEAFKMGLKKDSECYDDLVKYPCSSLEEIRNRASVYVRLEEDKGKASTYDNPNRKMETPHQRNYRSKPYYKGDQNKIHAVDDQEDDDIDCPKISDYCFSVDISGILCAMNNLGDKARWPKKNEKNTAWKDKSKWCAYHEDFGHLTEECIALRKEISYLLSKGLLKEILQHRKNKAEVKETAPEKPPSPPPFGKIIHFISGGSDICGTSYSAAKRHAKESKDEKPKRPEVKMCKNSGDVITFEDDDRANVLDPHHDSLVIALQIANCKIRRILVDGGSSVNLIMLSVLKEMGIPEEDIVKKTSVLVGFSGETKDTVGEIKLPVYVQGVNSMERFCVIDCATSYNVILGRPWIHAMKAVPSTYHQCLKLPTPWGVVKIESDQQTAKECYKTSMKASSSPHQA